jgi:GTP-binding protein
MNINFQKAEFVTSWFGNSNLKLEKRPEVLFAGRSNVGKSSMINKIFNRKSLAKTSQKPGKTISVNFFDADGKAFVVDLPGYGYAERSKEQRHNWGSLIDKYFELDRDIRMIILLVDSRHEPTENDILMYDYLMSKEYLFCVAATKTDKLSATQLKNSISSLSERFGINVIPFSSVSGQGVEEIRAIINYVCQKEENNEE